MNHPHSIRLRGPWQCQALPDRNQHPEAPPFRVKVPFAWTSEPLVSQEQGLRLTRHFQSPATLDEDERLWLLIWGADPSAEVSLNGERLGTLSGYAVCGEFEITSLLQKRNELQLDLPPLASGTSPRPGRESLPAGLIGEVWLEVRRTSHLRQLALYPLEPGTLGLETAVALDRSLESAELFVSVFGWRSDPISATSGEQAAHSFKIPDSLTQAHPLWPEQRSLCHVEVELVAGSDCLWGASLQTAWRTSGTRAQPGILETSESIVSRGIRSSADYHSADQQSQSLLQQIPAAWLSDVTRRLAHHPSIAAWIVPAESCEAASSLIPQHLFGRPVLVEEENHTIRPLGPSP